jgi:hypothetical protein
MRATDQRVTLVSEALASIRTIKIYGWEYPMMKRIVDARKMELSCIKRRSRIFAYVAFTRSDIFTGLLMWTKGG